MPSHTVKAASRPARSERIAAVRQIAPDARFAMLLRRKCSRAALTGAITAAIESIPGLGRVAGYIFGEVLDAQFLADVQRELVEETFDLYSLQLPAPLRAELVRRVQTLGTSASIASDALIRSAIRRGTTRLGDALTRRFLPIASVLSSAVSNASVTYAIGKRAQAVAKQGNAEPINDMPDMLRAFSGLDERRILDWSVDAVKTAFAMLGKGLGRMVRWPSARAGRVPRI